ncbi:protein translocase subunit SecE [Lentzea sp. NBRC 105346]|uniref:preprotein translocase subunit SecE n=1 Tax=Lentzea sp. NBRC 105346 TaxID=3032205 RepID=UPI002554A45B|nr:preprotein translocase subunit SecE [Lentzea sp. NBRC 105346]GLZ30561.1 protein translocase subunit SecE [Lentzea sp. NBRC 105346]
MSEGREQDQPEEREGASRPVTAAARRERRASSRPAARKDAASKSAKSDDESEDGAKKGRPTKARDNQEKRPGFIARFFRFLREVVGELRKVIWPTRKQLVTYTGVVLVFVIFMVALVWGLDVGFGAAVFKLFG